MSISGKIGNFMKESSWIRKMFEEGLRMKKELGEEKVQDLTLGNPFVEPPAVFKEKLSEVVEKAEPGMHRYMPNAGYEFCRAEVARYYQNEVDLPVESRHVVMTVGAAGALNVVLKSILDPGDEVIVFSPYFVEYMFYVDNHGGKVVVVKTNDDFSINVSRLEAAITEKTKAVLGDRISYSADIYEAAEGSDCVILMTEWNEFKEIDWGKVKKTMRQPVVLDGRNIYDPGKLKDMGFKYSGIGRS